MASNSDSPENLGAKAPDPAGSVPTWCVCTHCGWVGPGSEVKRNLEQALCPKCPYVVFESVDWKARYDQLNTTEIQLFNVIRKNVSAGLLSVDEALVQIQEHIFK